MRNKRVVAKGEALCARAIVEAFAKEKAERRTAAADGNRRSRCVIFSRCEAEEVIGSAPEREKERKKERGGIVSIDNSRQIKMRFSFRKLTPHSPSVGLKLALILRAGVAAIATGEDECFTASTKARRVLPGFGGEDTTDFIVIGMEEKQRGGLTLNVGNERLERRAMELERVKKLPIVIT